MRTIVLAAAAATLCWAGAGSVHLQRVPDGGIQPQIAVDEKGTVHLIYLRGEAAHADVFYVRSTDGGVTFSKPIQVNHESGNAIAAGTVRGAQIAMGRNGRVHVAWNGSRSPDVHHAPMLYTRSNDDGTAFEPERNLIQSSYGIDGGGAVAADRNGNVYVVWHAPTPGEQGEEHRRVWIARSKDDGRTFERETAANDEPTGACGCCGLAAFADSRGGVYALYRSAFQVMNRDMHLLFSRDRGRHFENAKIDRWDIGACVMSTEAFAEGSDAVFTAWETKGQVYMGRIDPKVGKVTQLYVAPGEAGARKHPAIAVNVRGDVLLAWTEGTGWKKGGSLAWQVFDADGTAKGPVGHADGVPVWGLAAAYPRANGEFILIY